MKQPFFKMGIFGVYNSCSYGALCLKFFLHSTEMLINNLQNKILNFVTQIKCVSSFDCYYYINKIMGSFANTTLNQHFQFVQTV